MLTGSLKRKYQVQGPFSLMKSGVLELEKGRGFYDSLLLLLEISGDKDIYLTVQDSSLLLLSDIIEKKKLEYRIIRKKNIAAVIMASGKSQRFSNENKLLKKIKGKALYQITVENVLKADIFSCILLVSGFDEILSGVEKYWNVYPVYNGEGDSGISMSIKKGVEAADSFKTDGYMFIPCDQVLLSPETLKELTVKFLGNSSSITVPVCRGKQVSPCIFPFRFRERLLELSGDKGGKEIIIENSSSVSEAAVSRDQDFFDIDTPDDFYVVKKILESE